MTEKDFRFFHIDLDQDLKILFAAFVVPDFIIRHIFLFLKALLDLLVAFVCNLLQVFGKSARALDKLIQMTQYFYLLEQDFLFA